jgi:hypothetical protein
MSATVPAGCLRAGDEITIATEDGAPVRALVRAVESRKSGHDLRLQSGTRAATVRYGDAERVERLAEAGWAA